MNVLTLQSSPMTANTLKANQAQIQAITRLLVDSGMGQLPAMAADKSAADGKTLAAAPMDQQPDLLAHFLNRSSYGYSAEELDLARDLGLAEYLEYQLAWEAFDIGVIENLLHQVFDSLSMDYAEVIHRARSDNQFNPAFEIVAATLIRAAYQPNQLYEMMVEFWSNHFNVNLFDGAIQVFKGIDDRDNIRPHALGRFRDLLHANAKSPVMLLYLDGFSNTADGPNENYARELMELHTLGVNGGYTEDDVKEVARCFTGWTITEQADGLFFFFAPNHDTGAKTVLGQTIPAGGGIEDGEQVLDLLASHPSTAAFIAKKLCQRFISDEPPQAAVDAVATTFTQTDGDIKDCLRTLFLSDEFAASSGQKFKRPVEYVLSLVRTFTPVSNNRAFEFIYRQTRNMKQTPFAYPAPTGYSDQAASWLNTNALLDRWNLAFAVAFGDLDLGRNVDGDNEPSAVAADFLPIPVLTMLGSARSAAAITDRMIEQVLHHNIGQNDRDALIQLAAGGQPSTVPLPLDQALASARAVLAALLASRHFQQR
ncbi:DUF1800 domain-containing protein [Marinicella meishanensis]|uniref:DUF1800 domain-containing protein n=1 Tax=Marinicella meishanensis TaxID=2873263 RepID=UPI001CBEBB92|nr:DUF1800 domain-containing protein [Marinicella sp. NBU2979]